MNRFLLYILFGGFTVCFYASPMTTSSEAYEHSNSARHIVPLNSNAYRAETARERLAWELVLQHCTPIDSGEPISESCFLTMTQYFNDQPVWDYRWLYYFDKFNGWQPVFDRQLYFRAKRIPYGYEDYTLSDIPLWNDIFDGQIEQRQNKFLLVVADNECLDLKSSEIGGGQTSLADRCASREMYKYATYLDYCVVSDYRLAELDRSIHNVEKHAGASLYDVSKKMILETIEAPTSDSLITALQKGYLNALWVSKQCKAHGFVLFPNDTPTTPAYPLLQKDNKRFLSNISRAHKASLKIAAKSGDEWALYSYPFNVHDNHEFIKATFEEYPLLMHRHFGNPGGGFRLALNLRERDQHLAKMYFLLEEIVGKTLATSELERVLGVRSVSDLQAALQYVNAGGELSFPKPGNEIARERERKRETEEALQGTNTGP